MKKAIFILFVLCILVCSLAGCNKEGKVEQVDISDAVQHTTQDGQMILTGFDGEHKHIVVPDSVNGADVTMLSPSFATGKNIESVKLPEQINAFIRQDNGLSLCMSSFPNSVGLNKGNAAAVYCEFFNVDSITVNGVAYSKAVLSDQQNPDLSGEWKNTDIVNGARLTQVYSFADGKVTCTADSDVFEGTYEIKDGKLMVTLDDVTVEFEFVGDQLICWEHNIILSTKDAEDYAETSDTGWSYIVTPGGCAQLVGYHGSETNVTIPRDIDGYEVNSINSSVADTYTFTSLNYSGHGGISFAFYFRCLYYDKQTDNYILYSDSATDGNPVKQLYHQNSMGRGYDLRAEAYCKLFGQSSITIDGQVYSHTATNLTADKVIGLWKHVSDQYYMDMYLSLYEDGSAELHYIQDELCQECISGQYTFSGSQVYISLPNGTLHFDVIGDYLICWDGNNWANGQIPWLIALDFQKDAREGDEHLPLGYCHLSAHILCDTFAAERYSDQITFRADGTATVTIERWNWYNQQVQHIRSGNIIIVTDGTTTETFEIEDFWLIDGINRYYYPSWAID